MSESSKESVKNSTFNLSHQNHLPHSNNHQTDADNPPFSRLFLLVPRAMSESELNDAFKKFGVIEDVWLIRDRRNSEGKGIAYIKYELASEAARAQEEMNGKIVGSHSRPLKVIISSSRREGSVRDPDEHEKMLRLFVLVPKNYTNDDLQKAFEKFGTINNVKVVTDKLTGDNKGFGYITFSKASDAARALEECDTTFKPKFAEPLTSKRHRDREEPNSPSSSIFTTTPSSPSNSTSPRHIQHSSSPVVSVERYNYQPNSLLQKQPRLNEPTTRSPNFVSCLPIPMPRPPSTYPNLLESNTERRLIVRCSANINLYHISKLFDLIPGLEECSPIKLQTLRDHFYIIRYKTCQFATYAREKLHAFQFPDGEVLSVQYYDDTIVADLVNSQYGNYDTCGIGQLIHQMSNLQGSQEEYLDHCNIPLPPKQKYAPFDCPVAKTLQIFSQRPIPDDYLRDVFNRFGNLIDISMRGPRMAYATYSTVKSANKACEQLNGQEILHTRIKIVEVDNLVDITTNRKRQKV